LQRRVAQASFSAPMTNSVFVYIQDANVLLLLGFHFEKVEFRKHKIFTSDVEKAQRVVFNNLVRHLEVEVSPLVPPSKQ
jgi:hypothetical protein